jgi:hypothetical protein
MRASHAPMRGCLEGLQLVSTETKDNGNHDGEARVVLNLEEYRSRFENFDPRSEPNLTEDTVEEGGDP